MRPLRASLLPAAVLSVALLAPDAVAQLSVHRTGGTFGEGLDYAITGGTPFNAFVFVISANTGPLPLSIVDPTDPRVMEVGIDLMQYWVIAGLDASGAANIHYGLPGTSTLTGVPIHAQAVTLPGPVMLFDEISNRTSFRLSLPARSTYTIEDAPLGITGHAATSLPGGDVLLTGGGARDAGGFSAGFGNVLRYDHQMGRFDLLANQLTTPRSAHTATLLQDGTVLLVGGTDSLGNPTAAVERIDAATGAAISTSALDAPRVFHSATLLGNGKVLVVGGTSSIDFSNPLGALGAVLASTRLYDPTSNTWSNGPNLPQSRAGHRATLLTDGRVLVTGGLAVTFFLGVPIPSFSNDARRYDPNTNGFTAAGTFSGGRAFHAQARLADGRVMLVGGAEGDFLAQTFNARSDSRIYDPTTNSWSNGPSISQARAYAELVVSGSRKPTLIGGLASVDITTTTGAAADTIEVLDLAVPSWTTVGTQLMPRPIGAVALTDSASAPRALTTGESSNALGGATDFTAETFVLP
ncbi:MAG: kelch repeat-containing protein [Planctomycetota bacterium]